jgi:hypothetical protein
MTALPNIPPDAQRQFAPHMGATTVEVSTNHVAMVPTQMRYSSSSRRPPRWCRRQPKGLARLIRHADGTVLPALACPPLTRRN